MSFGISARTLKLNSRLTDYPTTKQMVLRYAVKGVPSEMKNKCTGVNCILPDYF